MKLLLNQLGRFLPEVSSMNMGVTSRTLAGILVKNYPAAFGFTVHANCARSRLSLSDITESTECAMISLSVARVIAT